MNEKDVLENCTWGTYMAVVSLCTKDNNSEQSCCHYAPYDMTEQQKTQCLIQKNDTC